MAKVRFPAVTFIFVSRVLHFVMSYWLLRLPSDLVIHLLKVGFIATVNHDSPTIWKHIQVISHGVITVISFICP